MKNNRRILSFIIAIILILSCCPAYAEGVAIETEQEIVFQKADLDQISNPFETAAAWKAYLQKVNQAPQKEDLLHDNIQAVLKERGISGLSKYQYYVLLMEEGLGEFVGNHILVSFIDGASSFRTPALNDLVLEKEWTAELFYTITLKETYDEPAFMQLFEQVIADQNVSMAEPDFVVSYCGEYWSELNYQATSMTEALEQIGAPEAWKYATGAGVQIGMVDSGVSDLGQNLDPTSPFDCLVTNGHGTAVCHVMNGKENVIGVAPDAYVHCVGGCKGCIESKPSNDSTHDVTHVPYDDDIQSSELINYMRQLINEDVCSVINLSIGLHRTKHLSAFLEVLSYYSDILFVQSAGNCKCPNCERGIHDYEGDDKCCGGDCESYGCKDLDEVSAYTYYTQPNYICVASVDRYDNLSSFSKYGDQSVHIAAPGDDLILPCADGTLGLWDGTSFSAPMVTAAAALLLEINPGLTAAELKNIILNSADVIPELEGKVQGARRLNVLSAVCSVVTEDGTEYTPAYSDRYAYVDTNGALWMKNSTNSTPTQIMTGIDKIKYSQKYLYARRTADGGITLVNIKNYRKDSVISDADHLQNVVDFAGNGDSLVTLDSEGTLRVHGYYDVGMEFWTIEKIENVKCFTLCGNMLAYSYTNSSILYVHPNISKWNQFEIITHSAVGNIYNMFSANGRIHYRFNTSGYAILEFHTYSGGIRSLTKVVSHNAWGNNNSINHSRWIYPDGNQLKIYRFDSSGNAVSYGSVTAPNGATITAAKVMGTRMIFKAGTTLYCLEGNPATAQVKVAGSNVESFACAGKMLAEIKNSGQCWATNGPVPGTFFKLADNVSAVAVSP